MKTSHAWTVLLLLSLIVVDVAGEISDDEEDLEYTDFGDPDSEELEDAEEECDYEADDCDHICSVINGKATCSCRDGFQLDKNDGKTCLDVDECQNVGLECEHGCLNLPGTYKCKENAESTVSGYSKVATGNDFDCSSCSHGCEEDECTCPDGYELDEDETTCSDIDECVEDAENYDDTDADDSDDIYDYDEKNRRRRRRDAGRLCSHDCVNTPGSYRCECPDTMTLNLDGRTCSSNISTCSHETVVLENMTLCLCPSGMKLSSDNSTCISDPCSKCSHTCTNNQCTCEPGFILQSDLATCTLNRTCPQGHAFDDIAAKCTLDCKSCDHGCIQNGKSIIKCICPPKFIPQHGVDDCIIPASCNENDCICPDALLPRDGECVPLNCSSFGCSHLCRISSEDNVTVVCECPIGMKLTNEKTCVKDPCRTNNGGCSHVCESHEGVALCSCPEGYDLSLLDKATCVESVTNPCEIDNGGCVQLCVIATGTAKCECFPGWVAIDDNTCESTDRCSLDNGGCEHSCDNTSEPITCSCRNGYVLNANGKQCDDVDECEYSPCPQICNNTVGGFACSCLPGYLPLQDGLVCMDVNECEDDNGNCSHECINTPGSYKCACPDDSQLSRDGRRCESVDLCLNSTCSQACNASSGRVRCYCFEGYVLRDDGKTCDDIDECDDPSRCQQICINTVGSYTCECDDGYRVNGSHCMANDLCVIDNGGCEHTCQTIANKVVCSCEEGFLANDDNAYRCSDVNECEDLKYACKVNMDCVNTVGSYDCRCKNGYMLEGNECSRINECENQLNPCGVNMECIDTEDGYECECNSGYVKEKGECLDVNECEDLQYPCGPNMNCINSIGSYECQCRSGFVTEGEECSDTNECEQLQFACGPNMDCLNTIGSYRCQCLHGFALDGIECSDVNECENSPQPCGPNMACINTVGSYQCHCERGYIHEGNECSDVNECKIEPNPCGSNITCVNTIGSYECRCEIGYEFNENECADVDECKELPCKANMGCVNTVGSYECRCRSGYSLKGKECLQINRCDSEPYPCGLNMKCVNTVDSYECQCKNGYVNEGHGCLDIDECKNPGNPCGSNMDCINTAGSYECRCRNGYINKGHACLDVDECKDLGNPCGSSMDCINTIGSYKCQCRNGYIKSGNACLDVNECEDLQYPCGSGMSCVNTDGSYRCQCHSGYTTGEDGCIDINECEGEPCGANMDCINTDGSYECLCKIGYTIKNNYCEDIDECQGKPYPCGLNMDCINTVGSYGCICKSGFVLANIGENVFCKANATECPSLVAPLHGNMICNYLNENSRSEATCRFGCKAGYKLTGSSVRRCNSSGLWNGVETKCFSQPCPRLPKPENGYLLPSLCNTGNVHPPDICRLVCHSGYSPIAARMLTCTSGSKWSPSNVTFGCSKFKPPFRPFIRCPANIRVRLKPSEHDARVIFPRPLSNMDFSRYIDSDPTWAKNLNKKLPPGDFTVIFRARSPNNETSVSCSFTITVLDIEKPAIIYCPNSMDVILNPGEIYRSVTWEEPQFNDNIGIRIVQRSKMPGSRIGVGIHHVDYIAVDTSGNRAHCHFTINVVASAEKLVDSRMKEAILLCPGHPARKINIDYFPYLPKNCSLHWLKMKRPEALIKNSYLINKEPIHFRHYDGWNNRIRRQHNGFFYR